MFSGSRFFNSHGSTSAFVLAVALASLITGCASTKTISKHAPVVAQIEPLQQMKPESSENPASKEQLSPQSLSAEPIQILGGVKNPGAVPYQEGADLSFYLSKTGAAPSAEDDAKIQIIRGEPGKKKAQEFNLKDGSIPPLKSGDIVIVHPPAQKTFIEKTIAVAASAAAILGTAALLVLVV